MLRVGIIGAGGIAHQHATCYQCIPEAKVVAVADIVPERADEVARMLGAEPLDHGDRIIERQDVDVVDICVPTYLHCEFALKAAAAGKHVLSEKPIALTMEEGLKMIEATRKANVKFMVAQVLRYFPENVSARKVMTDGSIGKPVMIRTCRGGTHAGRAREWYAQTEKSGGAIQDMLVHDIDFFKWCLGPIQEVYTKGNVYRKMPYLEYDMVTLTFQSGALALMTADWSKPVNGHFATSMEIVGTEGVAQYVSDESAPLQLLAEPKDKTGGGVAIPESPLSPRSNPYAQEIIAFLNSIEKNTDVPIAPWEALGSLRVALSALESARTGKPVWMEEAF